MVVWKALSGSRELATAGLPGNWREMDCFIETDGPFADVDQCQSVWISGFAFDPICASQVPRSKIGQIPCTSFKCCSSIVVRLSCLAGFTLRQTHKFSIHPRHCPVRLVKTLPASRRHTVTHPHYPTFEFSKAKYPLDKGTT